MVLQTADPHLKELVEPRREDGHELHALEERKRRVCSQVNKSICEVQPGQLTVEEPVWAPDKAPRRCDSGFHNPDATVKSCSPSQPHRGSNSVAGASSACCSSPSSSSLSRTCWPLLVPATRSHLNTLDFIGVVVALALVVHLANRFLAPEADPVLMPVVLMLNGIGFVMIYRLDASPLIAADAPWHYQAAWTALGVVAYVLTLFVVRRSRDLERYRYMLVFGALVLLVLPLAPYLGGRPKPS